MTTAIIPNASESVLVDSSGWLEYITADTKAQFFAPFIESESVIVVPTIMLYEVRKILLLRRGKTDADIFLSQVLRKKVVDLDERVAIAAAALSVSHQLPMADAIIYATSQIYSANLVTTDAHFSGLPGVTIL
jgi:predicted nucleic acid-binding protein